jgi:hypothetical protein
MKEYVLIAREEEGEQERGPKRVVRQVRLLAGMGSESSRVLARGLIERLKEEGIDAGAMPGKGREGMTVEELARVDLICRRLYGGPGGGEQGPVAAGADTISLRVHWRMLEVMARLSPGDGSALGATFATTNPLPGDVTAKPGLSEEEARAIRGRCWMMMHERLSDAGRTVTPSTASLAAGPVMTWGYVFFYAGNALASRPETRLSGHEMRDMAEGLVRICKSPLAKAMGAADGEYSTLKHAENLRTYARVMDENVRIAREAQEDMGRFFKAIADDDDAGVRRYSDVEKKRTAREWRESFSVDLPGKVRSMDVVQMGVMEGEGEIGVIVRARDVTGAESVDSHQLKVEKREGRWVVVEG